MGTGERRHGALSLQLYEYYPAALAVFDDWTSLSAWAFVARFPTPQALVEAGKRQWEKFLHTQKLYHPEWYQKRLAIFAKADEFCGTEAVTAAKSVLATALVKLLQTLELQLAGYRLLITECFKQHPDYHVFASLPGAGPKLAPRLLAELVAPQPLADQPQVLQCLAGS